MAVKKNTLEPEIRAIDRPDHEQVAKITISGEIVVVGVYRHPHEDSLFLWTKDMIEPVYFTDWEATLLIAVLTAAKAKLVVND